jgi:predicted ribosomally synthesized peptide with nif11-like leader
MSMEDANRFAAELKANPDLIGAVKAAGGGIAGIVSVAQQKGFGVSADDAKAYLASRGKGLLSDAQLGKIAGGKGGTTSTVQVQNTVTVTTVAAQAEVAIEGGVVAVAVIVVT